MATHTGVKYQPLVADDLYVLKFVMTATVVDFALYGVQTTLSIAAITILSRRQGRSYFTLIAIWGLFLASTASVFTDLIFYLIQIPSEVGTSERAIGKLLTDLNIFTSLTRTFNYVLSDAVLVWRAWYLWPNNRFAKGILSLCLCGSIGGGIAQSVWWPISPPATDEHTKRVLQALIVLVPLLITNVIATALIGVRVWYYRKEIKDNLQTMSTSRSRAERVLMLLLESGLLYCLFWVTVCVTTVTKVSDSDWSSADLLFDLVAHYVAGIYPTCVLFVSLKVDSASHSLLSAQVSQAMRFADSMPGMQEGPRETDTHCDSTLDTIARDTRAGSSATNSRSSEGILAINGNSTVDLDL